MIKNYKLAYDDLMQMIYRIRSGDVEEDYFVAGAKFGNILELYINNTISS